jgi:hypothetical protein
MVRGIALQLLFEIRREIFVMWSFVFGRKPMNEKTIDKSSGSCVLPPFPSLGLLTSLKILRHVSHKQAD